VVTIRWHHLLIVFMGGPYQAVEDGDNFPLEFVKEFQKLFCGVVLDEPGGS
jgi:hypothetical protein